LNFLLEEIADLDYQQSYIWHVFQICLMSKTNKTNKFTANLNEKRKEFEILLEKFNNMDDPIERYIKRLEMCEIREYLSKFDITLEIP